MMLIASAVEPQFLRINSNWKPINKEKIVYDVSVHPLDRTDCLGGTGKFKTCT